MEISEKTIYTVLKEIGVPRGIKGYEYIKKALQLISGQPERVKMMNLYSDIALAFNDKPSRIERAIRYAITGTFDTIKQEVSEKYFVSWHNDKSQPTNSEFLMSIIEYLKQNQL